MSIYVKNVIVFTFGIPYLLDLASEILVHLSRELRSLTLTCTLLARFVNWTMLNVLNVVFDNVVILKYVGSAKPL